MYLYIDLGSEIVSYPLMAKNAFALKGDLKARLRSAIDARGLGAVVDLTHVKEQTLMRAALGVPVSAQTHHLIHLTLKDLDDDGKATETDVARPA